MASNSEDVTFIRPAAKTRVEEETPRYSAAEIFAYNPVFASSHGDLGEKKFERPSRKSIFS